MVKLCKYYLNKSFIVVYIYVLLSLTITYKYGIVSVIYKKIECRGCNLKILESSENYLEAVLMLGIKNGSVRSIDVARELGFSKASVSVAMKNLRENGYVQMDEDGLIALLPKGREIAEKVYERHTVLTKLFVNIGVDENVAAVDACRVEHVISDETFDAIKKLYVNLQNECKN